MFFQILTCGPNNGMRLFQQALLHFRLYFRGVYLSVGGASGINVTFDAGKNTGGKVEVT